MMSAPAIVAGFLSEGYSAVKKPGGLSELLASMNVLAMILGVVVAAVSGYFAIRFMLHLISKASLNWFALYVILLGIGVIILQVTGVLKDPPADPQEMEEIARALSALLSFS